MNYNKKLETSDDIEVKTYYKGKCMFSNQTLGNVYVNSINVEAGTVNAKIGETATYKDYPKQQLFSYINHCCYSDGE